MFNKIFFGGDTPQHIGRNPCHGADAKNKKPLRRFIVPLFVKYNACKNNVAQPCKDCQKFAHSIHSGAF